MKIAQMLQALNWNEVMKDLDAISAQLEQEQLSEIRKVKAAAKARRIHRAIQNGDTLLSKKLR